MSFASFPLDTLGLPKPWVDACSQAGLLVAADILLPSAPDLARKLRALKHADVSELVAAVARAIVPVSSTALELLDDAGGCAEGAAGPSRLGGPATVEVAHGLGKGKERDDGRWIRTGDDELDALLGGGIRRGVITELVGESAAGKSHLSMMLALCAQHPDLAGAPGGALILTSERDLATARLVELARSLLARRPVGVPDAGSRGLRAPALAVKDLLDNIQTTRCADVDALDHALAYLVPALCRARGGPSGGLTGRPAARPAGADRQDAAPGAPRGAEAQPSRSGQAGAGQPRAARGLSRPPEKPRLPIRLIVLDSITALLRGETASTSAGLTQRSRAICAAADRLKALAAEHDLAVVVVNQVSDVIRPLPAAANDSDSDEPGVAVAAAGASARAPTQHTQATQPTHPALVSRYAARASQADDAEPPMLYRTQARWFSGQSAGVHKEAALGIVWANAVNTRVMLARTGRRRMLGADALRPKRARTGSGGRDGNGADGADVGEPAAPPAPPDTPAPPLDPLDGFDGPGTAPDGRTGLMLDPDRPTLVRRAHVVFSPHAPTATADYVITESGVHGVPGSTKVLSIDAAIRRRDEAARLGALDADAARGGASSQQMETGTGAPASSEFGDDVFDDLGDLPAEYWQGNFDGGTGDEPLAVGVVDFAPPRVVSRET